VSYVDKNLVPGGLSRLRDETVAETLRRRLNGRGMLRGHARVR